MDTRQLILYRDLKDQSLFDSMTSLLTNGGQQDEGLALILTFWPVS